MAQTLMFTGFFKVSSLHDPGNAGYKNNWKFKSRGLNMPFFQNIKNALERRAYF